MPAITNVNELQAMENDLAGDYWLANDIDASATSGWHGGAGFIPIGQGAPYFTGSFDMRGHTISDLFINRPAEGYIGLFGVIYVGAIITDGILADVDITGDDYVGALAGFSYGCTITSSYSTGEVSGTDDYVGGLIGYSGDDIVDQCYAIVNVTGGGNGIGGLVGRTDSDSSMSNCYARGNVSGNLHVGGLIGDSGGTVANCFSTGIPSGAGSVGGLIGFLSGAAPSNSFWDTETSGTAVSDGGTGKTTSEMKTKATFTDAAWDFIIIWFINGVTNGGYPFHWAMPPEPIPDAPRATVAVQDKITLEAIRNVEMAAGGRFYVNKEGKASYKSRYARNA